jgi:hypothetical protein
MKPIEAWLPVPGYEGLYEVSDRGRVKSCRRRRLLALVVNKRGYVQCNLYKGGRVKNFLVHRLVVRAFIGPIRGGLQVNHKNTVKTDNRVENLELVTAERNRQHAREKGLVKPLKGEANPRAKLTEAEVRTIRQLRAEGVTIRELAEQFSVTERTISKIVHRRAWAHVE